MLTGEGDVAHGSITLNPFKEATQYKGPYYDVAEDCATPGGEEGLPRSDSQGCHNRTGAKEFDHIPELPGFDLL